MPNVCQVSTIPQSQCGVFVRIIHKMEIPMAIPYQQIALIRFLLAPWRLGSDHGDFGLRLNFLLT